MMNVDIFIKDESIPDFRDLVRDYAQHSVYNVELIKSSQIGLRMNIHDYMKIDSNEFN